jgi:SOS-response transcriptional repressor LexA
MEYEQLADTYEPISAVETKFNGDQFAFKVTGNSMDQRRMQTGDYVICVPYWLNIRQPNNGDVVVVDRRRGDIHERTVKEIVVSGEAVEFWPRSSDPRHKPIVVNPTTWKAEDGDEVEIVGLVISISIPL